MRREVTARIANHRPFVHELWVEGEERGRRKENVPRTRMVVGREREENSSVDLEPLGHDVVDVEDLGLAGDEVVFADQRRALVDDLLAQQPSHRDVEGFVIALETSRGLEVAPEGVRVGLGVSGRREIETEKNQNSKQDRLHSTTSLGGMVCY